MKSYTYCCRCRCCYLPLKHLLLYCLCDLPSLRSAPPYPPRPSAAFGTAESVQGTKPPALETPPPSGVKPNKVTSKETSYNGGARARSRSDLTRDKQANPRAPKETAAGREEGGGGQDKGVGAADFKPKHKESRKKAHFAPSTQQKNNTLRHPSAPSHPIPSLLILSRHTYHPMATTPLQNTTQSVNTSESSTRTRLQPAKPRHRAGRCRSRRG